MLLPSGRNLQVWTPDTIVIARIPLACLEEGGVRLLIGLAAAGVAMAAVAALGRQMAS